MIRMIVSDVDGTLLPHGQTALDTSVFEAIRRLKDKGIRFCTASGRQYTSLRRLFAPVVDDIYFICENGSIVYSPGTPGKVLCKTPMPRRRALALCNAILAMPQCELVISGADTRYICPKQESFARFVRDVLSNNTVLLESPDEVPEDIIKVSAFCSRGTLEAFFALSDRWRAFNPSLAGSGWIDFTLSDKAKGLAYVCSALGISPSDVMAFGDNCNDMSMLRLVGHPCIMEGSARELKFFFTARCPSVVDAMNRLCGGVSD